MGDFTFWLSEIRSSYLLKLRTYLSQKIGLSRYLDRSEVT